MKKLTQDELNKVLDDHELYLRSHGKQGKYGNLYRCDVSKLSFRQRNISYMDFAYAICVGTDFSYTICKETTFVCADLTASKFNFAKGRWSKFNHARILGSEFINFIGIKAIFDEAYIKDTTFQSAKLMQSSFNKAILHRVDMNYVVGDYMDIVQSYIQDSVIENAVLKSVSFGFSTVSNLSLENSICTEVTFRGMQGNGLHLGDISFDVLPNLHGMRVSNITGTRVVRLELENEYVNYFIDYGILDNGVYYGTIENVKSKVRKDIVSFIKRQVAKENKRLEIYHGNTNARTPRHIVKET